MNPEKLPGSWTTCSIDEAGAVVVGQQKSPEATSARRRYPYLRVANVQDDELNLNDVAAMGFSDSARERYRLRPGDILLCEGQSRELVGRCAMFNGELAEVFFQNTLIRFRSFSHVIPEYALLVFRAYQRSGIFSSIATSTTNIAHLGLRRFAGLQFPVPPRQVQQAIADLGRELQNSIDIARHALMVAETAARELPGAVRDVVLLEGKTIEEASVADHWSTAAQVVAEGAPIVYGILQPGPDVPDATGIPYIRGQDLQDGEILEDQLRRTTPQIATRYERSALAPGDVLLGIIRSTRVAIVPPELDGANITQGTARLRPGSSIDSGYLAHWVSSNAAQNWLTKRMRGIDMPGLNLRDVRQLPVPVPALDVQIQAVQTLDAAVEQSRLLISSAEAARKHLAAVESTILPSLAYGELASQITTGFAGLVPLQLNPLVDRLRNEGAGTMDGAATRKGRGTRTARNLSLVAEVGTQHILDALSGLGGRSDPEDLFATIRASVDSIDSFYASLRSLVRSGAIRVERSGDSSILIRN